MMTERKKRFAFEYVKDMNATRAAIRAGYAEANAATQGSQLLHNPEVAEEIRELQEMHARVSRLSPQWIVNIWMQRAMADPRDIVSIVVIPCKLCWPEGLVMTDPNPVCELCGGGGNKRVDVKDTSKLKGPARYLYAGAHQTKDGIKILMHSQDEALKNLANYIGIANRTEISGPGGGPLQLDAITSPAGLTDAQLEEFIRIGSASLGVDLGVEQKALPVTIEGKVVKE